MMNTLALDVLGFRIVLSIIGLIGNSVLILSIVHGRLKSFEVFLLGLATSNLEAILVVDVYDVVLTQFASVFDFWSCQTLKFLTVFGEAGSILFTVLISIFRYQKLRDAGKRGNLPIFLDNIRSAWVVSGCCVALAILLSTPIYLLDLRDDNMVNLTTSNSCPPDFFHCHKYDCPFPKRFYKYLYIFVCNVLPLFIITVTGCFIVKVLLVQRSIVLPALRASGSATPSRRSTGPRIQRSTVAVLAAMGVFQVDWTIYLILHLVSGPDDLPFWSQLEFFIITSYTTVSPYVYGIGNNFFSLKKWRGISHQPRISSVNT